jgi:hypothetical protein
VPLPTLTIEPLAVSRRIAAWLLITVLILGLAVGLMYQAHERVVADVGSVERTPSRGRSVWSVCSPTIRAPGSCGTPTPATR